MEGGETMSDVFMREEFILKRKDSLSRRVSKLGEKNCP